MCNPCPRNRMSLYRCLVGLATARRKFKTRGGVSDGVLRWASTDKHILNNHSRAFYGTADPAIPWTREPRTPRPSGPGSRGPRDPVDPATLSPHRGEAQGGPPNSFFSACRHHPTDFSGMLRTQPTFCSGMRRYRPTILPGCWHFLAEISNQANFNL